MSKHVQSAPGTEEAHELDVALPGEEGPVRRAARELARAADPAHLDPGLLRESRYGGDRSDCGGRSPSHQGARQRAHGRDRGGGDALPAEPDAEPHHHRKQPAARARRRRARPARRKLRSGHQGHRYRAHERHRPLPRPVEARRQRVSGRARFAAPVDGSGLQSLQQPRDGAGRPCLRLRRGQGRRRVVDHLPQLRPGRCRRS